LRKSLGIYEMVQGLIALPEGLCSMQLVCGAVQFGRQVPPRHQFPPTKPHGITSQKTVTF